MRGIPGERGGDAIADIIFGNVSPSGKLPITFPKSVEQLPAFDNYSMEGRTYKYMKESPIYPFGFGLSYAEFEWEKPSVGNSTVKKDQNLKISLNIRNKGSIDAEEVVQIYLNIENGKENLPISSLVDFKRIAVNKGKQSKVTFSIPYKEFAYYNSKGDKIQHHGKATITIGNASPGERSEQLAAKGFKIDVSVD